MLKAEVVTGISEIDEWPFALNEFTVHRNGAAMLGVDVTIDGVDLPTYWSDGLIVSTSSGSTAYSLSAGGPIVLPESRVLIVTPIAPHNLNVRPLVVPDTSVITLKMHSRDGSVIFTADNRTALIPAEQEVVINVAQFSLKRVRLNRSNFIEALTEKLYWGEDVRNIK
jgi:NAD+ kinase